MCSALKMSSRCASALCLGYVILGAVCIVGSLLVLIGLYVRFRRNVSISFRRMLHTLTVPGHRLAAVSVGQHLILWRYCGGSVKLRVR